MTLIHEKAFAPPLLCNELTLLWECNCSVTSREHGASLFFDRRVLHIYDIHGLNSDLGNALLELSYRAATLIRVRYGAPPLYPDDVQIVKWWEGHEMLPHADSEHADGTTHGTPWRKFASVVYLNSGYTGGQLYFPRLGLEIAPERGDLVAFGGGLDYLHGVRRIESGTRYTAACWFTTDTRHANSLYMEHYRQ